MYNTVRQGVTMIRLTGQVHLTIELRLVQEDYIDIRVHNDNESKIICSMFTPYKNQVDTLSDVVSTAIKEELVRIMREK